MLVNTGRYTRDLNRCVDPDAAQHLRQQHPRLAGLSKQTVGHRLPRVAANHKIVTGQPVFQLGDAIFHPAQAGICPARLHSTSATY